MQEKILELYFNEKMKQKDIATKLNISTSTVSRTIQKDIRYIEEKKTRKQDSEIRHNKDIQKRVENKRKTNKFERNNDELILKNIHNQDTMELSKRSHLSNENYRKWNCSAYQYNPSKHRYEFRNELGRSYDVPKYIKERY